MRIATLTMVWAGSTDSYIVAIKYEGKSGELSFSVKPEFSKEFTKAVADTLRKMTVETVNEMYASLEERGGD